ncbi:MAG TPA: hypothetical protein VFZ66_11700 [Herpetosiphonaceae bacterium]
MIPKRRDLPLNDEPSEQALPASPGEQRMLPPPGVTIERAMPPV